MNRKLLLFPTLLMGIAASAQTQTHVTLHLSSKVAQDDAPVVLDLAKYGDIQSALVTIDGAETPCQLDDLDRDGTSDELAFLTSFSKKGRKTAVVTLYADGTPRSYPARTFAEIVLGNPKVKEKNKHNIYLSSITLTRETADQYHVLHHHGVAFENELVAMRIYMDQRQTVDLYGKYRKGLELHDTQFYASAVQKAQGYGDDVLWVGNTFGLGALRGWDGSAPTMLSDVEGRTQRIVAQGPVRTIVEMDDYRWTVAPGMRPVNMTVRYTLYAGHRDCDVTATFSRDMSASEFSTGIINVKSSTEFTDHAGLRGCWGTDWPATDTLNWKRETVGLGIYVPAAYKVREVAANKDNYAFVVRPVGKTLRYSLAYCSDNENFGYHTASDWFAFLKEWKKRVDNPVMVKETER